MCSTNSLVPVKDIYGEVLARCSQSICRPRLRNFLFLPKLEQTYHRLFSVYVSNKAAAAHSSTDKQFGVNCDEGRAPPLLSLHSPHGGVRGDPGEAGVSVCPGISGMSLGSLEKFTVFI